MATPITLPELRAPGEQASFEISGLSSGSFPIKSSGRGLSPDRDKEALDAMILGGGGELRRGSFVLQSILV